MAEESSQTEKAKAGAKVTRDTELSTREDHHDELVKIAGAVEQGYKDQWSRTNDQKDYWDIYQCRLNDNQAYDGRAQTYIPLVRDAIEARAIRFTNQLFPLNGRYVECITEDGDVPHAIIALVEHYIERAKIRTEIAPALCKNGDVEGQYNVYVSWSSIERNVTHTKFVKDETGEHEETIDEVMYDEGPTVECIPDADILVLPAIADSIDQALAMGGSVSITRRWSKATIEAMIENGDIVEEIGDVLVTDLKAAENQDVKKDHVSATGIKAKGSWYLARETWHMLEVDGKRRLCRSYFGSDQHQLLGTKLNPLWCDLVPIISAPVKKMSGAFKGGSLIEPCAELQYRANDFLNQGADAATYSLMPILMTNLEKNPKAYTLTMDVAAVWPVDPNTSKIVEFPPLWQQAFELVAALKGQIQQSLGVNPSMIPATSGKSKRSQADIANEQAVDVLTTADAVTVIEQEMLSPMVRRFVAYDAQFRHEDLMISMFGTMGRRAKMEKIPPQQMGNRIEFKWSGVQAARNAAQMQQTIAWLNVIKGVPPTMYRGHRLDLTAFIEAGTETVLGPRLAPLTFINERDEMSMDPEEENKLLAEGVPIMVSPMDDDKKHMQVHAELMASDTTGVVRVHMQEHQKALVQKAAAAMQQQVSQMGGGGPGPREGAQNGPPRPQGPPGMMHQDQIPGRGGGVVPMPRKM